MPLHGDTGSPKSFTFELIKVLAMCYGKVHTPYKGSLRSIYDVINYLKNIPLNTTYRIHLRGALYPRCDLNLVHIETCRSYLHVVTVSPK